jgi:hypothetical protein
MDRLQLAEKELVEIERKLAGLQPLQQRREQLRTFIAMGQTLFGVNNKSAEQPISGDTSQTVQLTKPSTAKAQILHAVTSIVIAEGPKQTRELLTRLDARGVSVGGADKAQMLSSILSRSGLFKSDRSGGGWVLVNSYKEETPLGARTPAGS